MRIRTDRVIRIAAQTWVGRRVTEAEQWRELVSVAMLGTDRRNPPEPEGLIADVVDDTVRPTPSERMLAQVAATVAVRRAGVLPGPPRQPIAGPDADDRPVCVSAAADRWHHVVSSWPVLEDEWMLTLITNGWRVPPDLVPEILDRHRTDPIRRARAELACGPLAGWLVGHLPELAARGTARTQPGPSPEDIAELPTLPIPPGLIELVDSASDIGTTLASSIVAGDLGAAHRAVLVNLIARVAPGSLRGIASALESVESTSSGYGLAAVLADLALTRQRMLDELH